MAKKAATTKASKTTKAAKAAKPSTGCNCLKEINEQLEAMGARLQTGFQINFETGEAKTTGPFLAVERVGSGKKKLPTVLCTYCPCCGKKK